MAQQRVPGSDMDGFLDVRWANEDPNPRAQARIKREHANAFSQVCCNEHVQHFALHKGVFAGAWSLFILVQSAWTPMT